MKRLSIGLIIFVLSLSASHAENPRHTAAAAKAVYLHRADKIVATLSLSDAEKMTRVRDTIVAHYQAVNAIDDATERRIQELKREPSPVQGVTSAAIKTVLDEAQPKFDEVRAQLVARLSTDLSPPQIEQVKDGLTYGVLPLTYRVYQQMLPDLTAEQKVQILAWLTEAREHALTAGSSEGKHAWFGRYKGKINNYLAKAGYNMKQAEKDLAARNKAAAKNSPQP